MRTLSPISPFGFVALAAMGTAILSYGPIAAGQTVDEPPDDEIIVTSRKWPEQMQNVPLSITTYDAEAIEAAGFRNVSDLADQTPGFTLKQDVNGINRPVIRGMAQILGKANSSFFIDGVYLPDAIGSEELYSLQRVEVIKGPQSALYGRSTFGGAINYVTLAPSNDYRGHITLTGAEHGEFDAFASHSGPLVKDQLYYYVGGRYLTNDGEYRNTVDGKKVGDQERYSGVGKLYWIPSANFDATLRVAYSMDDQGLIPAYLQGAEDNNCQFNDFRLEDDTLNPDPKLPNSRNYFCGNVDTRDTVGLNSDILELSRFPVGMERERIRTSLQMNYAINDNLEVTSITSYAREDREGASDGDFTPTSAAGGFFHIAQDETDKDWYQELRLASLNSSDRIRWMLGGAYYDLKEESTLFALPVFGPPGTPPTEFNRGLVVEKVDNKAVFGLLEGDLTDDLIASAELRYASENLKSDTSLGLLEETYNSWLPRFTMRYTINPDAMVYVVTALGNKPGGFNTRLADESIDLTDPETAATVERLLAFDEESAWSYEIGAKTSWLDNRLKVNVAGFLVDWTDQQLTTNVVLKNMEGEETTNSVIDNIGKTRVLGFEVEVAAKPTPNWDIRAAYAFADPEIRDFVDPDSADLFGDDGQVAGSRVPRASKHQAVLTNSYQRPLGNGFTWFGRSDLIYESSRYAQVHNLAGTGDLFEVNLRTGFVKDNLRVTVFADNLFDDNSAESVMRFVDLANRVETAKSTPGTTSQRGFVVALPEGRQIGVRVSYDF